jgi:hypothetical protein
MRSTSSFADPATGAALGAPVAMTVNISEPAGLTAADERELVLRELTAALAEALG